MVHESRFLPNNKTFPVVELLTKSSLVNKTADTSSTGGAMLLREYSIYTRTRAVHCELIRSPWKRTTTPFSNLNKEMWNKDNERNLVLPVLQPCACMWVVLLVILKLSLYGTWIYYTPVEWIWYCKQSTVNVKYWEFRIESEEKFVNSSLWSLKISASYRGSETVAKSRNESKHDASYWTVPSRTWGMVG